MTFDGVRPRYAPHCFARLTPSLTFTNQRSLELRKRSHHVQHKRRHRVVAAGESELLVELIEVAGQADHRVNENGVTVSQIDQVPPAFLAYCRRMTKNSQPRLAEPLVIGWASNIAGRVLAVAFTAIRVLRQPRPIHPNGAIYVGHVNWVNPAGRKAGVYWLDSQPASGGQDVVVRVSRSVGLPSALPDVIGLAFKVMTDFGAVDLVLASSWFGLPSRFLLRPTRSFGGAFGSLMPYRGDFGPVLVGARTSHRDDKVWKIDLFHATPSSTWCRFAVVSLAPQSLPDTSDLRFDPIANPLPGADAYDWTRRLRQRSYRVARHSPAVPEYTAPNQKLSR